MTPHVSIRTSTSTPYDGLNLASAYAAARLAAALSLAAVRGCNHRERVKAFNFVIVDTTMRLRADKGFRLQVPMR